MTYLFTATNTFWNDHTLMPCYHSNTTEVIWKSFDYTPKYLRTYVNPTDWKTHHIIWITLIIWFQSCW